MLNHELFPAITERTFAIGIPLDEDGLPRVALAPMKDQDRTSGAIPLTVQAELNDGRAILLTPCGNLTSTPITQDDPYVMRFADVVLR